MTECAGCGCPIRDGSNDVFVKDGKEELDFCDRECMKDYYEKHPTIDMEMDE
jgi:ribosomal protein L24E